MHTSHVQCHKYSHYWSNGPLKLVSCFCVMNIICLFSARMLNIIEHNIYFFKHIKHYSFHRSDDGISRWSIYLISTVQLSKIPPAFVSSLLFGFLCPFSQSISLANKGPPHLTSRSFICIFAELFRVFYRLLCALVKNLSHPCFPFTVSRSRCYGSFYKSLMVNIIFLFFVLFYIIT